MKYFLVPSASNNQTLEIIGAQGFTPENSIPIPNELAREEIEWLNVEDEILEYQQPVYVLDEEGNAVFEEVQVLDGEGNPTGESVFQYVHQIDESGNAVFETVSHVTGRKIVTVNEGLKSQALSERAATQAAQAAQDAMRAVIKNARAFGETLMEDFIMENLSLGITQANMSAQVLDAMAPVEAALRTGSLYVAIDRINAIPAELKDGVFISDARLSEAVGKIQAYLGIGV